MATIIVNNKLTVKGHLTLNREKQINELGEEVLVNEGIFQCHLYFEDINTIEVPRMKLLNVEILNESFGSDDYLMTYAFRCEDVDFNGVYHKDADAYSYLSYEEMHAVENELFKDECVILGGVSKEIGISIDSINKNLENADGGEANE